MKILILGGTVEARELAEKLNRRGHQVISALAGRTRDPLLPAGDVHIGPFGGVAGLCSYITAGKIDRLVDATHPFAEVISAHAADAAKQTGLTLVRLVRAPWREPPGWNWIHFRDIGTAARALPAGAVALVTSGHEGLAAFFERDDRRLLVRLIEPPQIALPDFARLILSRPPYTLEAEKHLLTSQAVSHLVAKNSGGAQTFAKLEAAHALGVQTLLIDRPDTGPTNAATTPEEAIAKLHLPSA